ncbi:hypothetical protein ACT47M_002743 [Cronobacter muytjensii]
MKDSNAKVDGQMAKKMRAFVPFWKHLPPEFIELSKDLLFLLRRYGIDKMEGKNPLENRKEFFCAVHEGWKILQKNIASEVIIRLEKIDALKKDVVEYHKQKNSEQKVLCKHKIDSTSFEIKILRRYIDAVVWTMFSNEHSTIRRLPLPDGNDNLSVKNINDSMVAADIINENPTSFAIISDLTTFVHAGDIIKSDFETGITLAEVKSGKKNIEFSHAAQFSVATKCPYFDDEFTKDFDAKDVKHYKRTKKQWERLTGITETINTGEGHDYYHEKKVKIQEINHTPTFFFDEILDRWREIKSGKNWSIQVIDECLYIGAYSKPEMGFVGFNSWMDITDFHGRVVNISDSIINNFAQPLFCLNVPDDLLEDIVSGDLIIVLCLDYSKFMSYGNQRFPTLFGLAPPPQNGFDRNDYFMIEKKAIYTNQDGNLHFLGTGLESRIVFDFQKPSSVAEWIYKTSDLYTMKQRKKQQEKKEAARQKKAKTKTQKNARRISRR